MLTRKGRNYHLGESIVTMSFHSKKPSTSMDPSLLTILEDIRGQLSTLNQRMNRIENDCRDGDRQSNAHWEDRVPRNH